MTVNTSLNVLPIQRQNKNFENSEQKTLLKIDYNRDRNITDFGKATLIDRYLLPGEKFQDMFMRVANVTQITISRSKNL